MMGTIPENDKKNFDFCFLLFFVCSRSFLYLCHQYFSSRKHAVSLLICNSSKIELVIIDLTTKMKIVVCCYFSCCTFQHSSGVCCSWYHSGNFEPNLLFNAWEYIVPIPLSILDVLYIVSVNFIYLICPFNVACE